MSLDLIICIGTGLLLLAFLAYAIVLYREKKAQSSGKAGLFNRGHLEEADTLSEKQKRLLTFCLLPSYIRQESLLTPTIGNASSEEIQAQLRAEEMGNRDDVLAQLDFLLSGMRSTSLDNQLIVPSEKILALRERITTALHLCSTILDSLQSTYAWDLAEAAELAKRGFAAQYLNEDEFWCYLEQVSESAQRLGSDWYEHTLSYLLGRTMEKGDFDAIKEAASVVLHLPSSVVKETPELDAYTRYRFTVNKDATGMNLCNSRCHC